MRLDGLDVTYILSQLVRSGECCLVRVSDDHFAIGNSIPDMFKVALANCEDFGVLRFKQLDLTFIVKSDNYFHVLGVTRYLEVDEVCEYSKRGTGIFFAED